MRTPKVFQSKSINTKTAHEVCLVSRFAMFSEALFPRKVFALCFMVKRCVGQSKAITTTMKL